MNWEAWHAAIPGVTKSWTQLNDWTEPNHSLYSFPALMSSQAYPLVCNCNLDINFWDKLVYPYSYLSIKSDVKNLPPSAWVWPVAEGWAGRDEASVLVRTECPSDTVVSFFAAWLAWEAQSNSAAVTTLSFLEPWALPGTRVAESRAGWCWWKNLTVHLVVESVLCDRCSWVNTKSQ